MQQISGSGGDIYAALCYPVDYIVYIREEFAIREDVSVGVTNGVDDSKVNGLSTSYYEVE